MSIFKLAYYVLRGLFVPKKKKPEPKSRVSTADQNAVSLRMYVEGNLERLVAKTAADGLDTAIHLMVAEVPNFFHSGTYDLLHLRLRDALRREGHTDSDLYKYAFEVVEYLRARGLSA